MALGVGMTDRSVRRHTSSLKINFKISQCWASGMAGDSRVGLGFIWKLGRVGLCKAEGWERGKKNQGQPQLLQAYELGLALLLVQSNPVHGIATKVLHNPHPSYSFISQCDEMICWENEFLGGAGGSGYMWGLWRAVPMKDYVCNLLSS